MKFGWHTACLACPKISVRLSALNKLNMVVHSYNPALGRRKQEDQEFKPDFHENLSQKKVGQVSE